MDLNSRKLILRACLEKLALGVDVEANVDVCVDNMASLFEDIDSVLLTSRQREKTTWMRAALERASLDRVGNYRMTVHDRKKTRAVSFTQDGAELIFTFERKLYSLKNHFGAAVLAAARNPNPSDQGHAFEAIGESILRVGAGMPEKSPDEIRLGTRPQALKQYELKRVCLTKPYTKGWAGLLKFKQKKILFQAIE